MSSDCPARIYPMSKRAGHVPPVARYSSRFAHDPECIAALFMGVQSADAALARGTMDGFIASARTGADAPSYFDLAVYCDAVHETNVVSALYWPDEATFDRWLARPDVAAWRSGEAALSKGCGQWWEPICLAPSRLETIAFAEYRRGLSACTFSRLERMDETGYWGAARDRIPASAYDRLAGASDALSLDGEVKATKGRRISIKPPAGLTVIRSGVSWGACGPEQLESYQRNVRPKLDAGMEYLRQNPLETGCCSLRQVVLTEGAELAPEAYSLGHFLSLEHLEMWSKHHPTHLAIYHRALAERKKYQDRLELRTYNEIYILDEDARPFEYVNCHPRTGLIPYFPADAMV